jgi:hypothetical protein
MPLAICHFDTFKALPFQADPPKADRLESLTYPAFCDSTWELAPSRPPRLQKNLGGDLVGAVSARQSDQGFAVMVAELLHIPKSMTGPPDRQEHESDVPVRDRRLTPFDGLVLSGLDPGKFLQPEGSHQLG